MQGSIMVAAIKGPGVAVRAPAGTPYRIYGFVRVSRDKHPDTSAGGIPSASPDSTLRSSAPLTLYTAAERPSVYLSETQTAGSLSTTGCVDGFSDAHCAEHANTCLFHKSDASTAHFVSLEEILRMPLGCVLVEGGREDESMKTVRSCVWRGRVGSASRATVWRLLCGCIPPAPAPPPRQQAELRRKREEYEYVLSKFFPIAITDFLIPGTQDRQRCWDRRSGDYSMEARMAPDDQAILTQIALDLPRHTQAIFHNSKTASALARCLFSWSRRYPAVGYVQGIDDIMVIFLYVFLGGALQEFSGGLYELSRTLDGEADVPSDDQTRDDDNIRDIINNYRSSDSLLHRLANSTEDDNIDGEGKAQPFDRNTAAGFTAPACRACMDPSVLYTHDMKKFAEIVDQLPEELLRTAEADAYVCGGFFLSWLQDNFVQGQPGIRRTVGLMEKVVRLADPEVLEAITGHGITLMDCCFQWLHCLLARELPLSLVILLWERYMAMFNSETVYDFHAYVCAELLKSIRGNIIGQPVDVMLGLFKDPLEVRVARKHARSVEEGPYNDSWLRELIMRAFHFYQEHPPGDLSEC